jgi:small GTP-binding protein
MSNFFENNIKISIVGDSGNGKTSLMNKFAINEFDNNTPSTVGVDFRCKIIDVNNKKVKIRIWDTAGQEKFGEIIRACYRDSDGVIITYDITKYESFLNLEKWLEKVISTINRQYTTIIIVGTKSDLINDRKVSQEEVVDFILKNDLKYFEVSSKDGKNVNLLFSTMAEIIIEKIKDKPQKYPLYIKKKAKDKVNDSCCAVM